MTIERAQKLKDYLQELESVVVAFSGGVDSSTLAMAAALALGNCAVAVTAVSELLSAEERADARRAATPSARRASTRQPRQPCNCADWPG